MINSSKRILFGFGNHKEKLNNNDYVFAAIYLY